MPTAFSPASIGNACVGFDILGHSFAGAGDHVTVQRIDEPTVRIRAIHGLDLALPLEAADNTAGRALIALREALALPFGFEIEIEKGIPLGSGMGGSAASCVAALVAANALLETPLPHAALYPYALDGESVASNSRQGDNVAPMLVGGAVLATTERIIPLRVPDWLYCVVVHPGQVLETRRARAVLAEPYPLREVTAHAAHLAQFLLGLERADKELIRAGLHDLLVEPRRAPLVPGFGEVKAAALDHDALGASLSGAGPAAFAWFASRAGAEAAAPAMRAAFHSAGFQTRSWVSPVAAPGAGLIEADT